MGHRNDWRKLEVEYGSFFVEGGGFLHSSYNRVRTPQPIIEFKNDKTILIIRNTVDFQINLLGYNAKWNKVPSDYVGCYTRDWNDDFKVGDEFIISNPSFAAFYALSFRKKDNTPIKIEEINFEYIYI